MSEEDHRGTSNSPEYLPELNEQEQEVLNQLELVRDRLGELAESVNASGSARTGSSPESHNFDGFLPRSSQPVTPERPPITTGQSRSADDLPSASLAAQLRPFASTSRNSFVSDLPEFSRDTSPTSLTSFDRKKTRKTVREGFRSPPVETKLPVKKRKGRAKMSLGQQNEALSDVEDEGTGYDNPRWKLLEIEKDNFKTNLQRELEDIKETLDSEDSTAQDIEDSATELEGLEKELKDLEATWRAVVSIENIDAATWTALGNDLRGSRKELSKIKKRVQKALGSSDSAQQEAGISANAIALLRNSSQAPKVTLPSFSGVMSEYAAFKKNFKFVITQLNCEQKLWGTHLYNSLKGEAKEYVGSQRDWINRYEELWEMLDDKYANRWVLANETINTFICKPLPGESPEEINKFFYGQIDALKSVLELKMSLEQVGVSIISQSLPEDIGKDIKQGLRSLHPNKKQYAFSIKDILAVYNDCMAIRSISNVSDALQSTLSMKASISQVPPSSNGQDSFPDHPANPNGNSAQRGRGRGNSNARGRGQYRSRGQLSGRGGGRFRNGRRHCLLCPSTDHPPWNCPQYTDASTRRERLKELNLCIACAGRVHKGSCPDHIKCSKHSGYNHLGWTCGNEAHPGKQEPQEQ